MPNALSRTKSTQVHLEILRTAMLQIVMLWDVTAHNTRTVDISMEHAA
jgi:hypothetical protein